MSSLKFFCVTCQECEARAILVILGNSLRRD